MKNLLLAPLLLVLASAQSVFYRETFGTTTNNASVANVGWAIHSAGGLLRTADSTNIGLSSQIDSPTGLNNFNAGAASPQTSTGFVFSAAGNAGSGNGNTFFSGNNAALV